MPEIRVDEHLGRIYGDRYRLVAPVGTGASARVYMAEDQALRRRVAVKTLHPGLVSDKQFRRRFLAEAQVAAQVSHPHLLAVYDWGEHDSEAYLVTEMLSGGSLRDMLLAGHRLSESQALLVGLHAAQGLAAAHESGLVHRDIKPANLLFDEKGRVRIGDFGIARAVAEANWTEPEGALIGTARYAAPEQAITGEVDGRADVYSLALTLIEAVTGEVPLVSSTPIATMVLRQKADVVVPAVFGPLHAALAAAGHADRTQRPTANEFASMLRSAASLLPRPEPLVLLASSDLPDRVDAPAAAADVERPDLPERTELPERLNPDPVVPFDAEAETDVIDFSGQFNEPTTTLSAVTAAQLADDHDDNVGMPGDTDVYDLPRRRRRRWPFVLLILLAAAGVAGYFGYDYYDKEIRIPTHTVENYVGMNVDDAKAAIELNRWIVNVTPIRRDGTTAGTVLEQTPAVGTIQEEANLVTLVVSEGQELRLAPLLAGLTLEEATQAITDAKFVLGAVDDTVFDETVPVGSVLSASMAEGDQAETGTPIDLVLSAGPEPRQMPDVANQLEADATLALQELGFTVSREEAFSDTVAEGVVISAAPDVGTSLPIGSDVTITVSKGVEYFEVPNVVGLDAASAADTLQAAGFVVSDTNGPPNSLVLATDPPAGEFHPKGTSIVIFTKR